MKPILAAAIVATSLSPGVSDPVAAGTPPLPKAKQIAIPLNGLDCQPTRKFCVVMKDRNLGIRVLRCRIEDDASCYLAPASSIQELSPGAKVLKIAVMPDGCVQLTVRGP